MCMWFVFGDDWNDVLCWSRFAEHDFKRLLDRRLKRVWKTYSKEILFPVGSHVVAKAKSSKASEFKFPFPWCHFRFLTIFIFLVIVFLSLFSIVKSLNPGVISFSILLMSKANNRTRGMTRKQQKRRRRVGISGWGCAAGTLEPLTYTRACSAEFCYPILE